MANDELNTKVGARRVADQRVSAERANLTAASQNLFDLIQGRNLLVYPDSGMRLAVSRAVAIEIPRGWKITKEKASHRVDLVIALAMACHACVRSSGRAGRHLARTTWPHRRAAEAARVREFARAANVVPPDGRAVSSPSELESQKQTGV